MPELEFGLATGTPERVGLCRPSDLRQDRVSRRVLPLGYSCGRSWPAIGTIFYTPRRSAASSFRSVWSRGLERPAAARPDRFGLQILPSEVLRMAVPACDQNAFAAPTYGGAKFFPIDLVGRPVPPIRPCQDRVSRRQTTPGGTSAGGPGQRSERISTPHDGWQQILSDRSCQEAWNAPLQPIQTGLASRSYPLRYSSWQFRPAIGTFLLRPMAVVRNSIRQSHHQSQQVLGPAHGDHPRDTITSHHCSYATSSPTHERGCP